MEGYGEVGVRTVTLSLTGTTIGKSLSVPLGFETPILFDLSLS